MIALRLVRFVAILLMGWLWLSGVLLAARSIARAIHPLDVGPLLAAGVGLAGAAWLTRAAWAIGTTRSSLSFAAVLPPVATSTALLLWGACLTRGAALPAAAIFWLILVGEEGWAWRGQLMAFRGVSVPNRAPRAAPGDVLLQEFTRVATLDGEEIVRGSLNVTIERGSRSAAGHLAFCPPFCERPQFDVQPGAGENATVKVSQLYPHGARIEIKLPQPAQADATVAVHFVARAPRSLASP